MIIVQLKGGLGNQLFQYACGRAIAQRNRTKLKLDITNLLDDPLRDYRLNHFNITAAAATATEIAKFKSCYRKDIRSKIQKLMQRCKPYYKRSILKEKHYHFDPNILKASSHLYLIGYWQSEKYFADIAEILRHELTLKAISNETNQVILQRIEQTKSVSIHLRRGDFISNPETNRLHGTCSLDYYQAGVEVITNKIKNPHFFVFSDDMEWTQQHLQLDYPTTYVMHNSASQDVEDLRLMNHCQHHIIANSTFSWWGAWLCSSPDKIVVAPRQWFNTPERDARDLVPDNWLRI